MPTSRTLVDGDRVRVARGGSVFIGDEGVVAGQERGGRYILRMDNGNRLYFDSTDLDIVTSTPLAPRELQIGDWVRVARARAGGGGYHMGVEFQITELFRRNGLESYAEGTRRNGDRTPGVYLYRLDLVDAPPSIEEPATAPPSVNRTPLTKTREDVQAKLAEYRSAPTSGHARLAIELLEWVMA